MSQKAPGSTEQASPPKSLNFPRKLTEVATGAVSKEALAALRNVRVVCLDIDDTLSTHGKLTAEAYHALWSLKNAGFGVVPVTGRPAGWCDHIARFWPVHAVIGENGAFTFFLKDGRLSRIDTPKGLPPHFDVAQELERLKQAVLSRFPGARWASDQRYREFDLAIDFCEDVAPWSREEIATLVSVCEQAGATAKVSSIHVNAWFGNYTKRQGLEFWRDQGAPGLDFSSVPDFKQWSFIGDSPNDEPLFEFFPTSVGVANLEKFLGDLRFPPQFQTLSESGSGFVEFAHSLLQAKSN